MADKIKEILYTFACVVTGVLFACTLFITVFYREDVFSVNLLWEILATSFICSCGNLLYPGRALLGKQLRIRKGIHYIYINIVVFGCAALFDWFDFRNWKMLCFMILCIAVIFIVVSWIVWRYGKRESQLLNHRLKEYQEKKDLLP